MQKYGKTMEIRFHELEHESKMLFLKTRSHTSEQRGNESQQEMPRKREITDAYPKGTEKVSENHRHTTSKRGRWGENVSTETRQTEVAP